MRMKRSYKKVARFPQAILHFDGDSFFASVEQAMDYRLRGNAVITGGERGAVTSVSKEGKARGLSRGMTLREIKIRCPEAIIVPGDYVSYAIYAHRMYDIVRSYTPEVEEYSIDECFADITSLEEQYGMPYEEIGEMIKTELEESLGITFGVGLAPTKTLAKAASKAHKPAGFTSVPFDEIPAFTSSIPTHHIWGLGGTSGTRLEKLGAPTALDFAEKDDAWLTMHHLGKAYRDVWLELRGEYIKTLGVEHVGLTGSLMTTRTWKPPSSNRAFVLSHLSKNVEQVCSKARAHQVQARGISFYLKTQEFTYHNVSLELAAPVSSPMEVLKHIEEHFDEIYAPGILYRASGITLRGLMKEGATMPDLFGESIEAEKKNKIFKMVDSLNQEHGKQMLFLGSSMKALLYGEVSEGKERSKRTLHHPHLELGITRKRKTLSLPYMGVVR
jgi:nucleotidyltransferase/DNA polymerase involved in DNA repair